MITSDLCAIDHLLVGPFDHVSQLKFTLISFYLSVRSEIEESGHPMVDLEFRLKGLAVFSSSLRGVSVVGLSVL